MKRRACRRLCLAGLVAGVVAAGSTATASAATLSVGVPCARYVPGLAGAQWIPVSGTGYTPSPAPGLHAVQLTYADGSLGGYAPAAPDGVFGSNVFMPTDFIGTDAGRMKTYTLTATDQATGQTASADVTFVRAGVDVRPKGFGRNPSKPRKWSVYGAETGAPIYMHWTFKGRRHALRRVGVAQGPCGVVHRRMPLVPAALRTGLWKVYATRGKKRTAATTLVRVDVSVFRTFARGSATAGASVR